MYTVKNCTATIIINKSKFITNIYRVNTVCEAEEIITTVKKKYRDANHNCYAYIINNKTQVKKCSDDGEPQKTAGLPMLEVLEKNNLNNVLAITTRYFGGIKLGAGGLIRAYSNSVSNTLKKTTIIKIVELNKYQFSTDYALANKIDKLLDQKFILLLKNYDQKVNYEYLVFDEDVKTFLEELKNLSNNKIKAKFITKQNYELEGKKDD